MRSIRRRLLSRSIQSSSLPETPAAIEGKSTALSVDYNYTPSKSANAMALKVQGGRPAGR